MIRVILTVLGLPFYVSGMVVSLAAEAFIQGFNQMAAWLKQL